MASFPLPFWSGSVVSRETSVSFSPSLPLVAAAPARSPLFHRVLRTQWASSSPSFASLQCGATNSTVACFPSAAAASSSTTVSLREICKGRVPEQVLQRTEEVGYIIATDVQKQSLPILLSGRDCILHAQTGSGKTLAYLLSIFSVINIQRSAVQALIVVPTRELGMQVTKVARMLAAKPTGLDTIQKTCTIMALLDGGMLKRHKSWLKAEPPEIIVATIGSLCQMLEKRIFKLEALRVLVIDEVDFMFHSSKQVYSLRKLLTSYSKINSRQTIFASASVPQHNRFLYDCIQQKWTKSDAVHIHVNPAEPMPSSLCHKFVICRKHEKLPTLLSLLQNDAPKSAIIFVGDQDCVSGQRSSSLERRL